MAEPFLRLDINDLQTQKLLIEKQMKEMGFDENMITRCLQAYTKPNIVSDPTLYDLSSAEAEMNGLPQSVPKKKSPELNFLKIEFDGIKHYNKKNVIDLEKYKNCTVLSSQYTHFPIIFKFGLYGKANEPNETIMNPSKNIMYCSVSFTMNNEKYLIKHTGKKNNNGKITITSQFFKFTTNGKIDLSGQNENDTNNIISKYVGTLETNTIFSSSMVRNSSI